MEWETAKPIIAAVCIWWTGCRKRRLQVMHRAFSAKIFGFAKHVDDFNCIPFRLMALKQCKAHF